ncbi:hypothetical protein BU26DRAFT_299344 [Trematosphaeria pertusa]|uniref:Uncharacterized protein n=1 Tax=Trematosphaeria pertusa TaxID=390896 RepID=A0A6A6IL83_9PLEO|nr:uncharacterized protein BU26DRAFT_299344 [Trematosphaeria pertusa]KAF2250300.1 hypothetical protein BU26DRAFT_299344 [Trematosphaeria pertusa]
MLLRHPQIITVLVDISMTDDRWRNYLVMQVPGRCPKKEIRLYPNNLHHTRKHPINGFLNDTSTLAQLRGIDIFRRAVGDVHAGVGSRSSRMLHVIFKVEMLGGKYKILMSVRLQRDPWSYGLHSGRSGAAPHRPAISFFSTLRWPIASDSRTNATFSRDGRSLADARIRNAAAARVGVMCGVSETLRNKRRRIFRCWQDVTSGNE